MPLRHGLKHGIYTGFQMQEVYDLLKRYKKAYRAGMERELGLLDELDKLRGEVEKLEHALMVAHGAIRSLGGVVMDDNKIAVRPPDTVQSVDEIVRAAAESWQTEDVHPFERENSIDGYHEHMDKVESNQPTCPHYDADVATFDNGWYCYTCRVGVEEDV